MQQGQFQPFKTISPTKLKTNGLIIVCSAVHRTQGRVKNLGWVGENV